MYTITQEEIVKYRNKKFTLDDIRYLSNIIYNVNYNNFVYIVTEISNISNIYKLLDIFYAKLAKSCYKCNKFFKINKFNDKYIYKCNTCDVEYDFTKTEISDEQIFNDFYELIKKS